MGLYPITWGPRFWPTIHIMAKMYNVKPLTDEGVRRKETAYRGMFENLPYLLPCEACQVSASRIYERFPPPLEGTIGTNALFEWSVEFHNMVNDHTGKARYALEQAEKDFKRDHLSIETQRRDKDAHDKRLRQQAPYGEPDHA